MANDSEPHTLLNSIDSPADLRLLKPTQLPQLADEIRTFLCEKLNQCGGHFGANLGTVELTIALHYLYDTPQDLLVWDVGHQAYPHKILTGRKDQLHTIKQPGGLAPFPSREESPYDTFGTGHSSTSISAALGMALGSELNQTSKRVIAIIGDGGLTGGMALEALNHAGGIDPNMLIILNDNEMSISKNVGALTQYFGRILAGKLYCGFREKSKKILTKMPTLLSRWLKRTETHLKGMIQPGTLFEELGFNYLGPIDGHDLPQLLSTLSNIQQQSGAKILHVNTVKGKGYPPAEQYPIKYHAVKPGFLKPTSAEVNIKKPTYSNVFGQWLCDMAAKDPDLVGITPAMCEGSDLIEFAQQYPDRYFDVSIAEQHAVTFAAGLACAGKKPVVAIYSTFLQRAYDQLIHDVALQKLDVTLAIDRAGLVGSDGPTHAGSFDLSYLRCIPNMVIMAPTDENECRQMLYTAYQHPGPAAVRYPRGSGPGTAIDNNMTEISIGKGVTCRHGEKIAILAFGSLLQVAMQAGDALNATVINMRFVKPLDSQLIDEIASQVELIVTIEENTILGGAGSAVGEYLNTTNRLVHQLQLGLEDSFQAHGNCSDMLAKQGLSTDAVIQRIENKLNQIQLPIHAAQSCHTETALSD